MTFDTVQVNGSHNNQVQSEAMAETETFLITHHEIKRIVRHSLREISACGIFDHQEDEPFAKGHCHKGNTRDGKFLLRLEVRGSRIEASKGTLFEQ